ncbi:MAG: type III-A CRISPR-associated RAMP protein Csm5 [Clostridiales bacterium]|nr:type III-A CRISPR-associated RAMP protein Csm5 [Clostridiales bacterium]
MKIKIKILTPTHIGSGQEISPMEYFIDSEKGCFCCLNMDSLFRDDEFRPFRDRFIREAARSRYIGRIITDHDLLRRHILYSLPISDDARQHIIANPTNIKSFIKSAGRVYIPGSSLKGSLLSSMLWHAIGKNYPSQNDRRKKEIEEIFSKGRRDSQRAYDDLLKIAFPWIAPSSLQENPKFARWLDVSDSSFQFPQACLQISVAKVRGARKEGQLPILYESLKEGQIFELEIKKGEPNLSEMKILEIAHSFYLKVAEKDGVSVPRDPYVVRLGQGSTAFSTSMLLLAEDLGLRRYSISPPRTRKRIAEDIPMGFIQISN